MQAQAADATQQQAGAGGEQDSLQALQTALATALARTAGRGGLPAADPARSAVAAASAPAAKRMRLESPPKPAASAAPLAAAATTHRAPSPPMRRTRPQDADSKPRTPTPRRAQSEADPVRQAVGGAPLADGAGPSVRRDGGPSETLKVKTEPGPEVINSSLCKMDMTHQIGEGGSGSVYKGTFGTTPASQHDIVLKFPSQLQLSLGGGYLTQFWREASLLQSLRHPHIVKCFGLVVRAGDDFKERNGQAAIVMGAQSPPRSALSAAL